jgi:predicted DNA-binding antitoxin AbrB/MazE fold protein
MNAILEAMTTKLRARFDGNALIPLDPVDLPTGEVLEIEVRETETLQRGSPELLLRVMQTLPKLTKEDTDELERAIEEGRTPVRYDGVFDDLK